MTALLTWKFIHNCLEKSEAVMLLYVVDSLGSSPGRRGFMMAVTREEMSGSIGGGIMEHKFVEMAKEKIREHSQNPLIKKQVHNKSAPKDQSGMICSGEQTILLFKLTADHRTVVEKIISTLSDNQTGILSITPDEFDFDPEASLEGDRLFNVLPENAWNYKERLGVKNRLYIIGGGHCALALSRLMSRMDFHIAVFDEREKLNTIEQNTFANERKTITDYAELTDLLPEGEKVYVVIMTFGYRTDDVALRSIIHKDFQYLGVLGSKSKISKMLEEWRRDKLPEEKLRNIFAPVGLSINSRTPEEIAVSIAAQIISIKNR